MDDNEEPLVEQAPPDGFSTIWQIQNLPDQDLRSMKVVHVIGVLKDFQTPMRTKGTGQCDPKTL